MAAWTDLSMDRRIGALLRSGVLISAGVVLAGGCLYLARHGHALPDRRTFHGEPVAFSHPRSIVRAALAGDDSGIIAFGLLLLIATPVARVALAAYGFWREGDRLYAAIAVFVLAVLLWTLAAP